MEQAGTCSPPGCLQPTQGSKATVNQFSPVGFNFFLLNFFTFWKLQKCVFVVKRENLAITPPSH